MIVAGINETVSFFTTYVLKNNAVNSNLFGLVEFLLLMFAMRNLGAFQKKTILFAGVIIVVSSGWIFEYLIQKKLPTFDGFFHAYEGFIVSLTAVHLLNIQLTTLRGHIFTSPVFLICVACILYFSVSVLTEIFYVFIIQQGDTGLPTAIYEIMQWVNIIFVGMFAFALSLMPRRREFSLSI